MARPTHQFSQTKRAEIPRSSFDLSHGLKTAMDAGYLVPILSLEVLPGDTINCKASLFGRLATPIKPILDNLWLETFFFFTPYRQIWEHWVNLNGESPTPLDSTDYVVPVLAGPHITVEGGALDYMGIPPGTDLSQVKVNAMPFRCITWIYANWFRDQNIIDLPALQTDDGPDPVDGNGYEILYRRRKRRDYLTSVLPWPQKSQPIMVPLGETAPVIGIGMPSNTSIGGVSPSLVDSEQRGVVYANAIGAVSGSPTIYFKGTSAGTEADDLLDIYADLSQAEGISINDLRESFQIQRLFERDARGGTRYPEILKSHFGVTDPSMLVHQRPLFLGGGSSMININPVQQTSGSPDETNYTPTPQGNLAAYGTVSGRNHGFTQSFTEHGHIIGFANIRADLTYQQGLERYWSRQTRFDFYWSALSHLGEQAVLNKEIYISNDPLVDDEPFGYIPRYDEYRYKQSQITGIFRSSATASLDVWHLAQDFASLPVLNQAFIEDNPPIDRVIATVDEPHMLLDVYFKIRAARPLPLYATPGLIDHF